MKQLSFIIFFLLFISADMAAQQHWAEVTLSENNIKIGQQTRLRLSLSYMEGMKKAVITWPQLKDTVCDQVEIVTQDSVQNQLLNRASVLMEQFQEITVTSFDSGTYIIPSYTFIIDGDTLKSEPLELYVESIPVDTTKPIKDIKSIYDVPPALESGFSDQLPLWAWILIITGIAAIITGVIIYFTRKKKSAAAPVIQVSQLPHEKILEELAEIGRRKPWLSGEIKPYHTRLSEIMRGWIADRYRIHSREMTSHEIIQTLRSLRADETAVMYLERVLRTADMVKFAKAQPDEEDNERSLNYAIQIVQITAQTMPYEGRTS